MKSEIKTLAIKRLALDSVVEEFALWHQSQIEAQPTPLEWAELLSQVPKRDLPVLEQIRNRMLTAKEMGELRTLLKECGNHPRLYAQDRSVMNEVRCSVLDAIEAIQAGQLTAAYRALEHAQERLTWMLFDRKRDGYQPKYSIPADVLPRLKDTLSRATSAMTMVGRAAAAVA